MNALAWWLLGLGMGLWLADIIGPVLERWGRELGRRTVRALARKYGDEK